MEEKVYCRHVGKHSQRQRQGHLGEARMDMTRALSLNEEKGGRERGARGTRYNGQEAHLVTRWILI